MYLALPERNPPVTNTQKSNMVSPVQAWQTLGVFCHRLKVIGPVPDLIVTLYRLKEDKLRVILDEDYICRTALEP